MTFEVVSAGTDGTAAGEVPVTEENDKGLCLRITYINFDAATCGDVNGTDDGSRTDIETAVAPDIGEVDFAKINHHGSAFSSNDTFVDTLSAAAAVVSVGNNGFGHPDPAVLARWDAHGDVYQTQQDNTNSDPVDGTVTVTTTGQSSFTITHQPRGSRAAIRSMMPRVVPGARGNPATTSSVARAPTPCGGRPAGTSCVGSEETI